MPMHLAKFEIDCANPELVVKAVQIDDESEIKYTISGQKIIFEAESESLKTLMKIVYSTCNRIQLSMETIDNFKKN